MNKLQAYLQGQPKKLFAERIGVSPAYLSQLLSGARRPSYDVMLRIEAATDEAVDIRSWADGAKHLRPPARTAGC